jgi:hypothetical protein
MARSMLYFCRGHHDRDTEPAVAVPSRVSTHSCIPTQDHALHSRVHTLHVIEHYNFKEISGVLACSELEELHGISAVLSAVEVFVRFVISHHSIDALVLLMDAHSTHTPAEQDLTDASVSAVRHSICTTPPIITRKCTQEAAAHLPQHTADHIGARFVSLLARIDEARTIDPARGNACLRCCQVHTQTHTDAQNRSAPCCWCAL